MSQYKGFPLANLLFRGPSQTLISIIESTGVERVKERRQGREEKGEESVEGNARGDERKWTGWERDRSIFFLFFCSCWRIMGFEHEDLIGDDSHTCHLSSIRRQLPLRSGSRGTGHIKSPDQLPQCRSRSLLLHMTCHSKSSRARIRAEGTDPSWVLKWTHSIRPINWGAFRFSAKANHEAQAQERDQTFFNAEHCKCTVGHHFESKDKPLCHAVVKQKDQYDVEKTLTREYEIWFGVLLECLWRNTQQLPCRHVWFNISQTVSTHFALLIDPAVATCCLVEVKK